MISVLFVGKGNNSYMVNWKTHMSCLLRYDIQNIRAVTWSDLHCRSVRQMFLTCKIIIYFSNEKGMKKIEYSKKVCAIKKLKNVICFIKYPKRYLLYKYQKRYLLYKYQKRYLLNKYPKWLSMCPSIWSWCDIDSMNNNKSIWPNKASLKTIFLNLFDKS